MSAHVEARSAIEEPDPDLKRRGAATETNSMPPPQDPDVVDWDGPDDPANPLNWLGWKERLHVVFVSVFTLYANLAAIMFALGAAQLAAEFDITNPTVEALTIDMGLAPQGSSKLIPIIGGSFDGPRMSGKILDVGGDWGLTDRFGTYHADTRYQLRTDDGADIYIRTAGPAQADGTLHLRATFDTGSPDYYWLNNIIAVGVLNSGDDYVVIDAWQLDSPS
ncbi:hypothetical protein GGR56DRAFT_689889 [Xylariaceae sp. FL0804]|nr:hypothetical protein GGR56DRAFT_689889 [Xylariaceae sp. FL0804]